MSPEDPFRALVENVPVVMYRGVLARDGDPGLNYLSPRIRELIGYDPEEWLRPGGLFLHMHPGDVQRVEEALRAALAESERFEIGYRMLARDGREVRVENRATIVRDEIGRPLSLEGVLCEELR